MDKNEVLNRSNGLIKRAKIAYVGSIGPGGFPYIKAMMNLEPESLARLWFSTNTSSKRLGQLRENPNASVYYCDEQTFEGLLLIGRITVRQDAESRKKLWREGFEKYYPKGVNDDDYSVYEFNANTANFYHGLMNLTFNPLDKS
jgi:general stress protein 26